MPPKLVRSLYDSDAVLRRASGVLNSLSEEMHSELLRKDPREPLLAAARHIPDAHDRLLAMRAALRRAYDVLEMLDRRLAHRHKQSR